MRGSLILLNGNRRARNSGGETARFSARLRSRERTHEVALTRRPLVYLHIAGAGVNGNRGTAAVHFAHHALP